jgi:hypothetical protein
MFALLRNTERASQFILIYILIHEHNPYKRLTD